MRPFFCLCPHFFSLPPFGIYRGCSPHGAPRALAFPSLFWRGVREHFFLLNSDPLWPLVIFLLLSIPDNLILPFFRPCPSCRHLFFSFLSHLLCTWFRPLPFGPFAYISLFFNTILRPLPQPLLEEQTRILGVPGWCLPLFSGGPFNFFFGGPAFFPRVTRCGCFSGGGFFFSNATSPLKDSESPVRGVAPRHPPLVSHRPSGFDLHFGRWQLTFCRSTFSRHHQRLRLLERWRPFAPPLSRFFCSGVCCTLFQDLLRPCLCL